MENSTTQINESVASEPTVVSSLAKDLLKREYEEDRYLTKSHLSKGGMGEIKIVFDQDLKRILAKKIMHEKEAAKPQSVRAFIEEARITSMLQHPNIIPVHDIGTIRETGIPFYTMKLIEGESLLHIVEQIRKKNQDYIDYYDKVQLLTIFRKVCDAVAYSHSRGIIHRDIKPENIMVGRFGEVLLLDWGLAKSVNDIADEETKDDEWIDMEQLGHDASMMTMDGTIKGSLAYISPEQAMGDVQEIDFQTDVFLLGATLYQLLTLYPPYQGKNAIEVIQKAEQCKFKHPAQYPHCSNFSDTLLDIIMKSMRLNKKQRIQSADDLSQLLDNYLNGRTVSSFKTFKKNKTIIKSGQKSTESYIIVRGKVEISKEIKGKRLVLDTLEKGAIIGELSVITHSLRTADVVALEDTELLVLSSQLILDELSKLPPWMEKIIISLADKVGLLNKDVHPFMLTVPAFPILKQLFYIFAQLNTGDSSNVIAVDRQGVIHEIGLNLGLPATKVESILEIIEKTTIASKDDMGRLSIPDLDDLNGLIDYCRQQLDVDQAITIGKQIDATRTREYDRIHKEFEERFTDH